MAKKVEPIVPDEATKALRKGKIIAYHTARDTAILTCWLETATSVKWGFKYLNTVGLTTDAKHVNSTPRAAIESAAAFIAGGSNFKSHSLGVYNNLADLASTLKKP